jgi:hypothetical protein
MTGDLAAAAAHYAEALPYRPRRRRARRPAGGPLREAGAEQGARRGLGAPGATAPRRGPHRGRRSAPLQGCPGAAGLGTARRRAPAAAMPRWRSPPGAARGADPRGAGRARALRRQPPGGRDLLARQAALVADPLAAARLFVRGAELARARRGRRPPRGRAEARSGARPGAHRRAELLVAREPRRALEDLEVALSLARADPASSRPPSASGWSAWRRRARSAPGTPRPPVGISAYADARRTTSTRSSSSRRCTGAPARWRRWRRCLSGPLAALSGEQARAACRELVELSLELHPPSRGARRAAEARGAGAGRCLGAETLVSLLPPAGARAATPRRWR